MASDNQNLFGMFAPANFANHVCRLNRAVSERILHVDANTRRNPARNKAFQLALILSSHGNDGNRKVHVKTQNAGMRQIHTRRFRTAVLANHGDCSGVVSGFQKISKRGKEHHEILFWLALFHHKNNFAFQSGNLFDFVIDIEEIHCGHIAFRSACYRRTGPSHRVDVKLMWRWSEQLRFRDAARPAFPNRVFFEMHIFQANGLHFRCGPFLRFVIGWRARYA